LYYCCCAAKVANKQAYNHASYQVTEMAFLEYYEYSLLLQVFQVF